MNARTETASTRLKQDSLSLFFFFSFVVVVSFASLVSFLLVLSSATDARPSWPLRQLTIGANRSHYYTYGVVVVVWGMGIVLVVCMGGT